MLLRKDRFVVNEIQTGLCMLYTCIRSVIPFRSVFVERSGTNTGTHGKQIYD